MSDEKIEVKEENKSAKIVASLTLGIISILFSLFWYISIPTGILAIVFGAITTKKFGSKIGKSGLVTGIVGLSICAFFYISIFLLIMWEN